MKRTFFLLIILISLSSWKADTTGPWVKTKGGRIILYTRPLNYSDSNSPDSLTIQKIINEQEWVIDYINSSIATNFNSKVRIYLYNLDEAKAKIGTNGGGFASTNKMVPKIFFTFRSQPIFDPIRNKNVYVGIHEMVHVVTRNQFGRARSAFFGEGYANAIDGCYGAKVFDDQLVFRRNDSTVMKIKEHGSLLSPHDLLYDDKIPAREFYPQIGCLVGWMFETYGVEPINELYGVNRYKIENEFSSVTGDTFDEMTGKYLAHQKNL
jgi:hypothetical protein